MATITLQSSDGETCKVDLDVAKESMTIKTMLEDLGFEGDREEEVVPLPNVNSKILNKVSIDSMVVSNSSSMALIKK